MNKRHLFIVLLITLSLTKNSYSSELADFQLNTQFFELPSFMIDKTLPLLSGVKDVTVTVLKTGWHILPFKGYIVFFGGTGSAIYFIHQKYFDGDSKTMALSAWNWALSRFSTSTKTLNNTNTLIKKSDKIQDTVINNHEESKIEFQNVHGHLNTLETQNKNLDSNDKEILDNVNKLKKVFTQHIEKSKKMSDESLELNQQNSKKLDQITTIVEPMPEKMASNHQEMLQKLTHIEQRQDQILNLIQNKTQQPHDHEKKSNIYHPTFSSFKPQQRSGIFSRMG